MKIIGEKINGTRPRVARAIQERDSDFIISLAQKQVDAGSTWLDVNAGTNPKEEPKDLLWLIEKIQSKVDAPICLDSANPKALEAALETVKRTPMINSISGEPYRLGKILPLVTKYDCPVIALAMNGKKIPETIEARIDIIQKIIQTTRDSGISDDQVYIDPLVMAISTNIQSGQIFLDTIRAIRKLYPDVHFTAGLSNISFGLPARSYINGAFLILALQAGLDCVILDPTDQEMKAALLSAELVLGYDRYSLNFIRAYRSGLFSKDNIEIKLK
ncbi:MAG: dihydropteroate synthase [Actinobacteria bacterium]|nr:dihydropteroate synthase [Actinomycetota bacterium]